VAWTDNINILGRRFDSSGVAIGDEFLANVNGFSTTGTFPSQPSVACSADGGFVVVWDGDEIDGYDRGIAAQRFDSSGATLGSAFQVNSYSVGFQGFPEIAMDANGSFIVVWDSGYQDGLYDGVFGQRFTSDGLPSGTEFQVNTITLGQEDEHSIAVVADGGFVVTWSERVYFSNPSRVVAQRFDSGGAPLGTAFDVTDATVDPYSGYVSPTYDNRDSAVAPTADGGFVVVWQSRASAFFLPSPDGAGTGIFAQRFDSSGAAVTARFQVNSFTANYQRDAHVARAGSGFVVVWDSYTQDGDGGGIFAQRFDDDSVPLASELAVNLFTAGGQLTAAVACDAGGACVTVWDGAGAGDPNGIFGRQLPLP
jgi:hypothetical protein